MIIILWLYEHNLCLWEDELGLWKLILGLLEHILGSFKHFLGLCGLCFINSLNPERVDNAGPVGCTAKHSTYSVW